MGKWEEKFFVWLAAVVPEQLCYCCCVRVVAETTSGKYSDTVVPELTAVEALKRYGNDRKL